MAGINFRTASEFLDVTATSASTSGSPNNANTLFTCPASHEAEIVLLMVANESSSTANIGIQIFHADDSTFQFFVGNESIAGNSHEHYISSGPLFLHEGDKVLVFKHSGSASFDVTLSARLYYTPARRT